MAVDPIAAAIAATEQPAPAPIRMHQFNVTVASTGRPVIIACPVDYSANSALIASLGELDESLS